MKGYLLAVIICFMYAIQHIAQGESRTGRLNKCDYLFHIYEVIWQ